MTSRRMLFVLASLTDRPQTVPQVEERTTTLVRATGYCLYCEDGVDVQSQLETLEGKGLAVRSPDGRWAMRDLSELRDAIREEEEAKEAMEAKENERIWVSIGTLQERGEFRDRFGFKGGRGC